MQTIYSQTLLDHARTLALPTIRRILSKRRNAATHGKLELLQDLTHDLLRATRAALGLGLEPVQLVLASSDESDQDTMMAVVRQIESDKGGN